MANPVFNQLEREWQTTTPAGYPTMPGYQVGGHAQGGTYAPHTGAQTAGYGQAPAYGQTAWDQQSMEQAYAAPAADAVDRGRMTWDDVLIKTAASFAILVGAASVSWWMAAATPALVLPFMVVGFLGGLGFALFVSFSKTTRPWAIMTYAALEGVAVGAFSMFMEYIYPGIVVQALLATVAVFGVTLALYASGKVRNSPKLARFALIALVGILVYRLLDIVLGMTGLFGGASLSGLTIFGIELGLAVGLLAVVVGAICLIQDFDMAKVGVERGVPAVFAWRCAFGLMVTVVWMYLEILQILARLRD